MGPLPVAGSLSPDVNDPAFRAVSFDQLRQTYFDQAKALLEGGVDLLIVETIFDTLNAKAALFAITDAFAETGRTVPLMISGTVIDKSGRNLSGQTVEAFLISIAPRNTPYRGSELRARAGGNGSVYRRTSRIAPFYVGAYPNAGLPDPLSPTGFPETRRVIAPQTAAWAANGWLNVVGGCCGTTPGTHSRDREQWCAITSRASLTSNASVTAASRSNTKWRLTQRPWNYPGSSR